MSSVGLLWMGAIAAGFIEPGGVVADGFVSPVCGLATCAMADGVVQQVRPLVVRHVYYDNADRVELDVGYAGPGPAASPVGTKVKKGQRLFGRRVTVSLPNGAAPDAFARAHPKLFVPPAEPLLLVVDKDAYTLSVYNHGKLAKTLRIGYGQEKGDKTVRGDNRTPRGMYFVVQKHRGAFDGPYAAYFGGHWMKVNYPNAADAARGLREGLLDKAEAQAIARNWEKRALTDQTTRLGSGIGFHGWIEDWADDDPHLTWGCIVMHNQDIRALFDTVPVGTMVIVR